MQGYRLYGTRRSGAAMVEMALAEIGAPYEFVVTGLGKAGKSDDAFFAINPTGKVPALTTPEGDVLTESAAILIALAGRHPSAGLLPTTRRKRDYATAIRWLVHVVAEIYPMIEIWDYPMRFVDDREAARVLKAHARERLRRRWLAVAHALAGEPWLLESGFSAADLAIATVSRWTVGQRWRRQNTPRLDELALAVRERPLAGPVWQRHFG